MSLAQVIATGVGRMLRARLEIEGWGVQPVTHREQEQTLGDGRKRLHGLRTDGITIAAKLDLAEGSLDSEGFTAKIVDTAYAAELVAGFRRRPSLKTFLSANLTKSATTATVFSTTGWPSSGVLHIGTEAILYTGTTATTFTGLTRGAWGSIAQAHYTADGDALSYPHVTDEPITLEGRRVTLYLYGEGDDPTAAGTPRWRGVAATSASIRGREITFHVDPPTAILKQQLGGDTVAPLPITGIYYPWNAPFFLGLTKLTSATQGNPVSPTDRAKVLLTGRYADQAAFCSALTAAIASAIAAWTWGTGASITAQPIAGGFQLVYVTGTGTVYYVQVDELSGVTDRGTSIEGLLERPVSGDWYQGASAQVTVSPSNTYTFDFIAPVPRATFGNETGHQQLERARPATYTVPDDAATYPSLRVYVGGLTPLSTDLFVGVQGEESYHGVSAVNTSARYVDLDPAVFTASGPRSTSPILGPLSLLRIGRKFTTGNIGDLLQWLWANSPDLCNAGVCPLVTISDIAITGDQVRAATQVPVTESRLFAVFGQPVSLGDLIESHLAAAGMHLSIETTGTITARAVRLAASTELGVAHLTGTSAQAGPDVGGPIPILEQSGWGHFSDVRISTGYSPIEDEFLGPTVHERNVQATAPLRTARSRIVEMRSIAERYRWLMPPPDGTLVEVSPEEAARIAQPWLGLLGDAYDLVTLVVNAKAFDVRLGDAVKITHPMLAASDGTIGVVGLVGLVVGFDWEVATLKGALTVLSHARNVAGYAPGFRVSSYAAVSGNTWDLTLVVSEYTDETLADWLAAGMAIEVVERDATTATVLGGSIDSVAGAVVRVTFTGAWTPGGGTGEWDLELTASTNVASTSAEARFVYIAYSSLIIEHTDANTQAREIGP